MDRSQKRVLRLRNHVFSHSVEAANPDEDEDENEAVDDVEESEGKTDISKMKIAKLKELLDDKGIEYNSRAKKEDLIELLEGAE